MTDSTGILGNQEGLAGMKGSQGPVEDGTRKVMAWAAVKTKTRNLEFYSKWGLTKGFEGGVEQLVKNFTEKVKVSHTTSTVTRAPFARASELSCPGLHTGVLQHLLSPTSWAEAEPRPAWSLVWFPWLLHGCLSWDVTHRPRSTGRCPSYTDGAKVHARGERR